MKKAYFISDAHLGARYIKDKREHEGRLVRFLNSIKDDVSELYLLGDILDYWYEYRYVVPRGHIRFLGALASLADSGVKIYWFTGNHDVWLFDYLASEVGLTVIKGNTQLEIMGHHFLLSHGDDVGYQKLSYRITRTLFYNRFCQWLYASIHPRWTYPLASGLSQQNRITRNREVEERLKEVCAKRLEEFSNSYAATHPEVQHFVYGHVHLARHVELSSGRTMTITGDWIDQFTYATFDGETVSLHKHEE